MRCPVSFARCIVVDIRLAGPGDADLFAAPSAGDVFDTPPRPDLVSTFLSDPRHHIVLALDPQIVGFISAVDYVHPDKPRALWINEVSTHVQYRRRGIGSAMVAALLAHGRSLGCFEAWVIADPTDMAMGFYRSLGAQQTGSELAMFAFDLT